MENKETGASGPLESLVDAALGHVVFDGWSEAAFRAAAADCGLSPEMARVHAPRGGLDLAVAYHRRGDRRMVEALAAEDLARLRFRDRVAHAVRLRLELADREAVRRGSTLFALPQHMATGAGLVWGTADAIWTALGDKDRDLNWYSKRAILSAVYSATVLYWLGDESEGKAATWAFLDRRIEDVMRFEKTKASLRKSPLGRLIKGPLGFLERVRAPEPTTDLPGRRK